jgi:hypothetical protein
MTGAQDQYSIAVVAYRPPPTTEVDIFTLIVF